MEDLGQLSLKDINDAVTIKNLSYSYAPETEALALDNISFSIMRGSYTALVGSNGSGKSTLCRLICGLLEMQSGSIEVSKRLRIGLVFQSPKDQIVSSKVYRDTAFGPQNLRLLDDEVEMRTIECLSVTELLHKAEYPSNSISLGQTQKLAMAGMLAVRPDILILDEAIAMLDEHSRRTVFDILKSWHNQGNTIIHITHDLEAIAEAEHVVGLNEGRLFYEGPAKAFLDNKVLVKRITGDELPARDKALAKQAFNSQAVSFRFDNICFSYDKSETTIKNVSFDLYKGSLTALTGVSGAGKSTLLELGAGLLKPDSGNILCNEYPALAQQNCSAAIFEAFAADDVAFGPKNEGVKGKALVERVRNSMDMAGLPFSEYGERQSAGMSGGEQRRLAIAGILAMNRNVYFFDEPAAGLDGEARYKVMNMLRVLADEGKTVLFTTHHKDEADFADREIKIEEGSIIYDSAGVAPVLQQAQEPQIEGGEGLASLSPYESTSMLKGLKSFSTGISGSGWKTKCPLEKLPPALRILLFLLLFILSLTFRNTVFCGSMLVVSVIYCLFANFRFKRILSSVFKILPFLCFFAIFQLMFRAPLPEEVRYTTWRFFTITPSKLLFCLNSMLRTYSALLCVSAFFVSTQEFDLIDGLKTLLPSRSLILILEVIFRFIPLLVDEASVIIKTQIIRGGLGKVKGKLARIRAFVPLIVPLVIRTVRRSEILADAIVMRCFNEK